jgi:uncharacterized LabA/DUF88 family protein
MKPGERLNRVAFFTAVLTWDKEKQDRHKNYIKALEACGVEVVKSNFRRTKKHCRVMNRYCTRFEEKQTDVAIATMVISDAVRNDCSRVILITADSDQIPLVEALKELCPHVLVTLAAPPERGGEARALGELVDERRPITVERLRACFLPRTVTDDTGKTIAIRPALYATKDGVNLS